MIIIGRPRKGQREYFNQVKHMNSKGGNINYTDINLRITLAFSIVSFGNRVNGRWVFTVLGLGRFSANWMKTPSSGLLPSGHILLKVWIKGWSGPGLGKALVTH